MQIADRFNGSWNSSGFLLGEMNVMSNKSPATSSLFMLSVGDQYYNCMRAGATIRGPRLVLRLKAHVVPLSSKFTDFIHDNIFLETIMDICS